ncbi:oxidoreductase- FAD-binding [Apiospora hydei]|uniref:Oxidoreductase- FAD-binding n=1 Tax=Apiospora hydei TaxID=1337664 RepID=A0ABR1V4L2_9PEZI
MGRLRTCCLALSASLAGKVAFPLSQEYNASLASYFASQQSEVTPLCIVSPENTEDVSAAIRILTTSTEVCHFTIRSGGHSTVAGASNINAGVTVDLRHLSGVQLSPDQRSVQVGAGAAWGAVCDTAVGFEVVTADGIVVHANRREHPDLRWALCGGGNSFGVVTRVDLQTFALERGSGQFWGGVVYHDISRADDEIAALEDFSNAPETYDVYSSLIASFAMVYTKPEPDPAAFRGLSAIPSLHSTMRVTDLSSILEEAEALQMIGLRQAWATLTIVPTAEALQSTVKVWNASTASVQGVEGITWALVMDPLPPAFYARHSEENALGLGGRQGGALMILLLDATYKQSSDDGKVDRALRALVDSIERAWRTRRARPLSLPQLRGTMAEPGRQLRGREHPKAQKCTEGLRS